MTDIERILALCQTFIDEAQHQIDELGEAGAHEAVTRAKVCAQIIGQIALLPAVTSPERIPPAVRRELDDYASVGARPSPVVRMILEGDLYGAFALADHHHFESDLFGLSDVPATLEAMLVMPAVVAYIREALHASIYGSPEAVTRWMGRPRT
jgi:hypothetical protein